ncbi:MAG: Squalene-hopene cyclase-like protein [Chthoniobacteraceae bacterium]|nr:Squalene-hopene cyclase-like protein [Chthoniobacteraceae bacterium]
MKTLLPFRQFSPWAFSALVLMHSLQAQDLNVYKGTQVPPQVEKIYEHGLQYLVRSQNEEGSFPGNYGSEPAVAALAMMSMLAHGEDPNRGPYNKAIKRSLEFVLKQMNQTTGYIGNSMYNHGFCTLALAEAYGGLQDERIGPALKKAVGLILSSQEKNRFKAWRYAPDAADADSTVSGACFVALIAARNAGLRVPDNAIDGALKFFTDCQSPGTGGIGYTPGSGSMGGSTTAIGVAVYAYARKKDQPTFLKAFKTLKSTSEEGTGSYPFYFEYYASQALFQSDVKLWEEWNNRRVEQLTQSQNEDGSWDGSLGPALSTSFGLLSIALNYRYLPVYER